MITTDTFKIISTLGHSSLSKEFLSFCHKISQTNFRLNGSHLSPDDIQQYVETIHRYIPAPEAEIYLDLQGEKKRIGELKQPLHLIAGDLIHLTPGEQASSKDIPITDDEFIQNLFKGDAIYLQDATIHLRVENIENRIIVARVIKGGLLRSKAGILFPNRDFRLKEPDSEQMNHIRQAQSTGIRNLALSYLKSPTELQRLKSICHKINYHPRVIAKIEHPESLHHLAAISQVADEIWFCRGDLGMFIPLKDLSHWQTVTINTAKKVRKPVFIAGQVFYHLTEHAQPTRSEVVHFLMIKEQGINGIVLSEETAIGINPLNALAEIIDLI